VISVGLVLVAATVTGVAAGLAADVSDWGRSAAVAAGGAFLGILVWRLVDNGLRLNADFGPFASIGDMGCLIPGALGPALVGWLQPSQRARPAIIAGLTGFIVNVAIL